MSGKANGSKNAVTMRKYPSYRRRKEFWDGPRSAMVLLMLMGSIMAAGIIAYNYDYYGLKDKVNISLLTPSAIRQNGQFAMVVTATDVNGDPVSELPVKLILEGIEGSGGEWTLFEGKTDSQGLLMPDIKVPDYNGTADIRCYCGVEQVVSHVDVLDKVEAQPAKARIVINTDKPMYQPGQTVHIRALAFEGAKPMATARPMTILIKDPENNKIFRETLQPSTYGIVGLDLPLSDQLPLGEYLLRVSLDDQTYADKTFEVKRYVLPKFHITVEGTRNWYVADEDIAGTINITYMFGKKVDGLVTVALKDKNDDSGDCCWGGGAVDGLKGDEAARSIGDGSREITYGKELFNETLPLTNGKADFSIAHSIHSPNFSSGYNYWYSTQTKVLTVTVTDTADHTETKDYEVTIATEPFSVLVYSDTHMMDETSYYYLVVSTPNGMPVEGAAVSFTYLDQVKTAVSDAFGIAEVTFTYQGEGDAIIKITKEGYEVNKDYYLFGSSAMKVHAAKVLYQPGDMAVFDIKTDVRDARLPNMVATYEVTSSDIIVGSGTITLDKEGKGSTATIPITEAMAPASQLTVYVIDENGNVQSDTTIFAVEETSDLSVTISTDKGIYRPGTPAKVDFTVTDGSTNNGVVTALGVRIIDWSVLELSERLVSTDEVFHGVMDPMALRPEEQTAVFISDCGGEAKKLGDGMGGAVATDCIGTPALTGIVYDHGNPSAKPTTEFKNTYEMSLQKGDDMKSDAVAMFWAAAFSMGLVGLLGLVYASTRASMKSALPVLAVLLTAMLTGGLTAFMVLDLQKGGARRTRPGKRGAVSSPTSAGGTRGTGLSTVKGRTWVAEAQSLPEVERVQAETMMVSPRLPHQAQHPPGAPSACGTGSQRHGTGTRSSSRTRRVMRASTL